MEDLPIGSEIVLKVVKTEKEQCNGCFFDEICNNPGDFSDSDKKCAENFGIDYLDVEDFLNNKSV